MNEIFHDDVSISQYVEVHAIREELLSDEDVNEDEEDKKNDKVDAGFKISTSATTTSISPVSMSAFTFSADC